VRGLGKAAPRPMGLGGAVAHVATPATTTATAHVRDWLRKSRHPIHVPPNWRRRLRSWWTRTHEVSVNATDSEN
jgi:hypothetical protein